MIRRHRHHHRSKVAGNSVGGFLCTVTVTITKRVFFIFQVPSHSKSSLFLHPVVKGHLKYPGGGKGRRTATDLWFSAVRVAVCNGGLLPIAPLRGYANHGQRLVINDDKKVRNRAAVHTNMSIKKTCVACLWYAVGHPT